jgi:outer membrane protein
LEGWAIIGKAHRGGVSALLFRHAAIDDVTCRRFQPLGISGDLHSKGNFEAAATVQGVTVMMNSFFSRTLAVGALLIAGSPFAAGQTKIAIVKLQEALLGTSEIKKAQAELQTKFKPRQDEIERLNKELQDLNQRINDPKISDIARQDLQSTGQRKQTRLQRLNQDIEDDFNRDRQEILGRASQRMSDVIKKIAEEKGFDVVVDVTNTVFFKPALDITPEVTVAYDKAHPAK